MRSNNLTRANRFYRGLAIFFLVFTAFDLSSPELCQEEGFADSAITQQIDRSVHSAVCNEAPSSDRSHDDRGSGIEEHDCFCCCTHLTLVDAARIVDLNFHARIALGNPRDPSVASPQGIYHPPRLA
jgi:hypothetical protein